MSVRTPPSQSLTDLGIVSGGIPEKIASVITAHNAPSLYTRHWLAFSSIKDQQLCASQRSSFRAMQFNILAEGLSAHPDNTPPFQEDPSGDPLKASTCGGFDYDPSSPGELVFDFHGYRKWRLLEEILLVDPDVLALEEIDHFTDFFEPLLNSLGYKGIFQPKKNSPCNQFGYYSDGVALFWKEEVFTDSDLTPRCANDLSPCVVAPLKHRFTEKVVVFAATHLKSKPSEANELRRKGQTTAVMETMMECCSCYQADSMILLGDFNTDAFLLGAKVIPYVLDWNEGCLANAYPLPTDVSSGEYTTWKTRSGKSTKHLIDYMFYTHKTLRVNSILGPPSSDQIQESKYKLPDLRYPSDHISVAADLSFVV